MAFMSGNNNKPETRNRVDPALAVILLLAAFLRFLFSWRYGFTYDETFTILLSKQSMSDIVTALTDTIGSPLSYLILHVWLWPGDSPVWVQMSPMIFSVGAIWVAWHVARGLFGRNAAILGTTLAAMSPLMVIYSHLIRYPAYLSFFGTLSLHCVFHILGLYHGDKEDALAGRPPGWVWPVLLASELCCLFLHNYALYWIFALNVIFVIYGRGRGLALKWLAAQIMCLAGFAVWLPFMVNTAKGALAWNLAPGALFHAMLERKLYLFDIAVELITSSFINIHADDAVQVALKGAILLLFCGGGVQVWRSLFSGAPGIRIKYSALIIVQAVALLAAFIMNTATSGLGYYAQYFSFLHPLPFLLIGDIITRAENRFLKTALICAVAVSVLLPLCRVISVFATEPNVSDAMRVMKKSMKPGDVILVKPQMVATTVQYYIGDSTATVDLPREFNVREYRIDEIYVVLDKERFADLRKELDAAQRIWFVEVQSRFDFDPERLAIDYLENNFQRTSRFRFVESYPVRGTLTLYSKPGTKTHGHLRRER